MYENLKIYNRQKCPEKSTFVGNSKVFVKIPTCYIIFVLYCTNHATCLIRQMKFQEFFAS